MRDLEQNTRGGVSPLPPLLHYGEPFTVNVGGGGEEAFSLLRGLQMPPSPPA
jgi:hypothetical protein